MNKVILIGNLTKDPEFSTTSSEIAMCRFNLAVSRGYASADGSRETDFLPIIVWRALAENCNKFLRKGSKACVVGSVQTRSYDANDGTKRYVTEVVASEVEFLNSKSSDSASANGDGVETEVSYRPAKKAKPVLEPIDDDDLPF